MTLVAIKDAWHRLPEERRRAVKVVAGVLLGGAAGATYYAVVGCSTGSCLITSNPWISTAWGAAIGGFTAWG